MRTSPVHYIAPSAISIIPNCNGTSSDLAVNISRGTKIKVYCPRANINKDENGEYQEWSFTGRNRRLANPEVPYTIYARLNTTNKSDGYLVFAPMRAENGGEYMGSWTQKYSWPTADTKEPNGFYTFGRGSSWEEQRTQINYIHIRLGDVSLPDENNQRTVNLDTGILGTDVFNSVWDERPDELPLRIEFSATINDEDAGAKPYVRWGQSLVLTAMLTEGWTGTDIKRFHHWTIARNSGDTDADAAWPAAAKAEGIWGTGSIALSHERGPGDDFNGAVSSLFTVTAWQKNPDHDEDEQEENEGNEEETPEYIPLISANINILAETIEKYELVLDTGVMAYDPASGIYDPQTGIGVRVRATDQRGVATYVARQRAVADNLAVQYIPVDGNEWQTLTPGGPDVDTIAVIPTTAFAAQKSINVRLVRVVNVGTDGSEEQEQEPVMVELAVASVAFVRNGEDSAQREYIYRRSQTRDYGTHPKDIGSGEVNPEGTASGSDTDKSQDGWVPNGWTDDWQGANAIYKYEFESYRDYEYVEDSETGETVGRWGDFTTPRIHDSFVTDGGTPESRYQWNDSPTQHPDYTSAGHRPTDGGSGWTVSVPDRPQADGEHYLWMTSAIHYASGAYGTWSTPVRLTGDKGDAGEDGADMEYIYRRLNVYPFPDSEDLPAPADISQGEVSPEGTADGTDTNKNQSDWVPNGWSDTALPAEASMKYVYMAVRHKPAGNDQAWGDFSDPILWSNWGVQGIDGDGVQYIYKLFDHELNDAELASQKPTNATKNAAGEWLPTPPTPVDETSVNYGWSDEPLSPDVNEPFCYCTTIRKTGGRWNTRTENDTEYGVFDRLGLWSVYAESGLTIDLDNEMDAFGTDVDGVILADQPRTTHVSLFYGTSPQTITALTATVRRADNNNVISDASIVEKTLSGTGTETATVTITVKEGATIACDLYVDIEAACAINTRSARFSLKRVASSAPGVSPTVYQLLPSMSSVPFARTSSGAFDPPSYTVKCGYVETTGNASVSHPDAVSTGTYNIYYRKNAKGSYTKLTTSGVTAWPTDSFVEFILCTNTAATVAAASVTGLIDRETVPVVKDGEKGDDGLSPNPNILLRTIFDKGIDFVLEAWTRADNNVFIDTAANTVISGRRSIRLNASQLSYELDFQQNVFGRVKPSTWYTLSFCYFSTAAFSTFLYQNDNAAWIDTAEGIYVDGAATPTTVRTDGYHEWPANWEGKRHSVTFKTSQTFSVDVDQLMVLFRCPAGGQAAICMPKLEEGREATPYVPHEEDLAGQNADTPMYAFQWNQSPTQAPDPLPSGADLGSWYATAPDRPKTAGDHYLWMTQTIKHTAADGTVTYDDWSPAVRISGDPGAQGDGGYGLTLSPSSLIFEEKLGNDGVTPSIVYENNEVTVAVYKGKTPLTPTITKKSNDYKSGCNLGYISVFGSTVKMINNSITLADGESSGYFTINVKADNGGYDRDVRINFYVTRMGTFERKIKGDMETVAASKIEFGLRDGGVIKSAYDAAIETSATGLTQRFTEQVSRAAADGRNLFGFSNKVQFAYCIPFIQGYGIVVKPWENTSDMTGRIYNLGMYGRLGYYTVSCQVRTSTTSGFVRLQMNWHQATKGSQDTQGGIIGVVSASPSEWTKLTATFHFDNQSESHIGTSLQDGEEGSYARNDINGYIDIGQVTSATDATRTAVSGNYIYMRHLKVEYRDFDTDWCESDEDIAYIGQGQLLTAPAAFTPTAATVGTRWHDDSLTYLGTTVRDAYYVNYDNGTPPYKYNDWSEFLVFPIALRQLTARQVYTLSFWARATQAGFVLRSTLRLSTVNTEPYNNDGAIVLVPENIANIYAGGNGEITEDVRTDGITQVTLTTEWRQYFVRYYVARSAYLHQLVAATIYDGDNVGKNCTVYIGDVQLQEGYVMSESSFTSLIEQNARRISLVQQSGARRAGIDIQDFTVNLFGDRVTFSNADGTVKDKVWIDPDKGTLHAVGGEFSGVVRATNFFHSVAISGSYTVGFCNNNFLNQYSEESWIGNFTYGGYYTEEEAYQLSGGNVGIVDMVRCTGAADIVVIKATTSDTREITVTLPRAQDYEGKIVEIVDTRYTQQTQGYVGLLQVMQCDGANCMKGSFTQGISISNQLTLNGNYEYTGGSYRLMSYKEGGNYYWVKLGTS